MGINTSPQLIALQPPPDPGTSMNYLIEACFQESDQNPIVLPYYNAADPSQPYSGPTNSGLPQATSRIQSVQLLVNTGIPSSTGTQLTPAVDAGWVGLYVVTVSYGQTAVLQSNIEVLPRAPFTRWKLPDLGPGFGSGIQSFVNNDVFTVPAGVTRLEVELSGRRLGFVCIKSR